MAQIKLLATEEIKKIAAGEVVERPATVVKELVENALDADAHTIQLYIRDGGRTFLRIVDDGCGMMHEDALLACTVHATSKIVHIDDLQTLQTYGFRGEALAAIAAVSTLTVITRDGARDTGTKLVYTYGVLTTQETVSCSVGTDIMVEGLFDNVPARKKFLKSVDTEFRAIQTLMHAFILAHTNVHFKVFNNEALIHNCPATPQLALRFVQLWDHYVAENLVEITGEDGQTHVAVAGLVSRVQQLRYNTAHIFLLVNKRWVKNIGLLRALLKGYSGALPQGRYPIAALLVTVDPSSVDVNIHPRKEEVKFVQDYKIEQLVQESVKKALERDIARQIQSGASVPGFKSPETFRSFTPFSQHKLTGEPVFTPGLRSHRNDFDEKRGFPPRPLGFAGQGDEVTPGRVISEEELFPSEKLSDSGATSVAGSIDVNRMSTSIFPNNSGSSFSNHPELVEGCSRNPVETGEQISEQVSLGVTRSYRLIGQTHKTYLLLEKDEELIFVDQHAAHERILYEYIVAHRAQAQSIALLFPHTVTLCLSALNLIMSQQEILAQHGIVVDSLGADRLVIKEVPVYLKHVNLTELVYELRTFIEDAPSTGSGRADENFLARFQERLCIQMACKAAVKAGDELSFEKMYEILDKLQTVDNRLTCPHGRPTVWTMSTSELEKKFRRDYKK
jgi:DNA mismatch repair protein MutL